MKKITKIIVLIFAPFILAVNRVFALVAKGEIQELYGPSTPIQPIYGVLAPTPMEIASAVFTFIIIPVSIIVFLIFGIRKWVKNKKRPNKSKR